MGAPDVRKVTLRKSTFPTLGVTMSERGPQEGPKGVPIDPKSPPREALGGLSQHHEPFRSVSPHARSSRHHFQARSLLHVRVVHCSSFESFDAPRTSLHARVVRWSSVESLDAGRSSLHVRVLRCSAVEAFDARCESLHVPVVCCSSVWLAGSGPPSSCSMQDVRPCMFVSFPVPPLRPSTLDVRRCMFLSLAARPSSRFRR